MQAERVASRIPSDLRTNLLKVLRCLQVFSIAA